MPQTNPCLISTPSVALSVSGANLLHADVVIPAAGSGAGQALGQLASANANGIVVALPSGTVWPYAGGSVPAGFLLCDGTAVSRTTYAALFAALGTTWGVGDGSTTFNLPDLRGRTFASYDPVGGTSGFTVVGNQFGEAAHALTAAEMPVHDHGLGVATSLLFNTTPGSWGTGVGPTIGLAPVTPATQGTGAAHNNMPPYAVVNWMVAA